MVLRAPLALRASVRLLQASGAFLGALVPRNNTSGGRFAVTSALLPGSWEGSFFLAYVSVWVHEEVHHHKWDPGRAAQAVVGVEPKSSL